MVACSLALNAAGESVATDMESGPKERGGGESNFDVDMIATAVTRLVTTGRRLRFSCLPFRSGQRFRCFTYSTAAFCRSGSSSPTCLPSLIAFSNVCRPSRTR